MEEHSDQVKEAVRLKAIAEAKFKSSNLKSAVKHAKKAYHLHPNLDGISSMLTAFKILRVAAQPHLGLTDWYKILKVEPFSHINTIKKQYKNLALVLHPDKNPYLGCEDAFKLVGEGFRVLSDKIRRKEYDMKLRIKIQEERDSENAVGETFWTACSRCRLLHQFERKYLGHNLVCPSCKKSFEAVEVDEGHKEDKGIRDVIRSEGLDREAELSGAKVMGDFVSQTERGIVDSGGKIGEESAEKTGRGEKMSCVNFRRKVGNGEVGGGWGVRNTSVEGIGSRTTEWSGGRVRSLGLRRKVSSVGEMLERTKPKKVKFGEESMTLAQMQLEAKKKAHQEKEKLKEKVMAGVQKEEKHKDVTQTKDKEKAKPKDVVQEEKEKEQVQEKNLKDVSQEKEKEKEKPNNVFQKEKESDKCKVLNTNKASENQKNGASNKSGNLKAKARATLRKGVIVEIEKHGASINGLSLKSKKQGGSRRRNVEIVAVVDSDFYDFGRDRVERSFRKGQVWAVYDDDDGMPRHYGLIDEVISVNPFEVTLGWLDLQSNADQKVIGWEKMGYNVSCGRFKVARKTTVKSLGIFSHIVECERAAREAYRIFPKKGSVWAVYNEAAFGTDVGNQTASNNRCYDIVVFLTTYSEINGLSMAYLEKVDGFKAVFKIREIGCHAISWFEKGEVQLISHQIPSRKLSGDEVPDLLKDCWELDPTALPSDYLT
ncbi:hypothetical protein K2173_002769 [Erythroxylum novogranatense]|uniref:J domain-containing protein n=1 Tax=Erythroxylum novogranatense TaxID=1862640 RepID=A0AAV8SQ57_9ROSI|nr:hypothetical protein K2173_002769 [Erythroxylum novogranatense]